MIIVKITDGLGNQMFQYSFAKYMQKKYKQRVFLDIHDINRNDELNKKNIASWMKLCDERKYELDQLRINLPTLDFKNSNVKKNNSSRFMRYCEYFQLLPNVYISRDEKIDNIKIRKFHNYYFQGSFFDYTYLKEVEDELREDFQLKNNTIPRDLIDKMIEKEMVSVHIRRRDFLKVGRDISGGRYYKSAFSYVSERLKNPFFYVFSDDIEWVKNNMNFDKCVYVSDRGLSSAEELVLMSKCKYNIIANSTFSFWAAWLNKSADKFVIYPFGWRRSIIPDSWIGL